MTRPAVLFYCQHLLGVGHISRSLAICRALMRHFDVVFVQGGPDIGRTIDAPEFSHVFLPPLLMREHDSSLYDPSGQYTIEELWVRRAAALEPVLERPFAAVVVELFPFGRYKLKTEILDMMAAARARNSDVKIYCSNRDIMVKKPDQAHREAKIVRVLNEHFDHLLVHTDPDLIPLDDTFAAVDQIRDQLLYTGYVVDGSGMPPAPVPRERRILVSVGGGAVGPELAPACARIAHRLPDYEMRVQTGPYTSEDLRRELARIADSQDNLTIHGFSGSFRDDLCRAALSISLAGYNTLMDLLATRTPALVYPYMANIEQNMRAQALAAKGLVDVLGPGMLEPDALVAAIEARLAKPVSEATIDLSGAQTTARIIARHVSNKAP